MPHWASVVLASLGGVAGGAIVGWPIGRRMRGRPVSWLGAMIAVFLTGCWLAYVAMRQGRELTTDAWLGFAFGAMTAIKYAGGILPGTAGTPTPGPTAEKGDDQAVSGRGV